MTLSNLQTKSKIEERKKKYCMVNHSSLTISYELLFKKDSKHTFNLSLVWVKFESRLD